MFSILAKNPKRSKLAATCRGEVEKPIPTRDMLYSVDERTTAFLLPILAMSHPAKASEMKNPRGSANSIVPRDEALRLSSDWIVGIREAQLAKHSPCKKKNTLTLLRFACGETDCCKILFSAGRDRSALIKNNPRLKQLLIFLNIIAT